MKPSRERGSEERETAHSKQEEDMLNRSNKKPKDLESNVMDLEKSKSVACEEVEMMAGEEAAKVLKTKEKNKFSYCNTLIGLNGCPNAEEESDDFVESGLDDDDEEDLDDLEKNKMCLRVLMELKEKLEWRRQWRTSVIVKLLGKTVSLKFLKAC